MTYQTTHLGIAFTLIPQPDGSIDIRIAPQFVQACFTPAKINNVSLMDEHYDWHHMRKMPRYHITKLGHNWYQCLDKVTGTKGYGETFRLAAVNCQVELEMATSDIHQ